MNEEEECVMDRIRRHTSVEKYKKPGAYTLTTLFGKGFASKRTKYVKKELGE